MIDQEFLEPPRWCPTCEPERDPIREIVFQRFCEHHAPDVGGSADAAVPWTPLCLAGTTESGGVANRQWCRLIHGGA